MTTPVPAEWTKHRAMWVGFPSHADLWQEDLAEAQDEVTALVRTLATTGDEVVRLLVHGDEAMAVARAQLGNLPGVELIDGRFGDIWLRDTGPIIAAGQAFAFRFNGWGGKYVLPDDDTVSRQIADHAGLPLRPNDFVLEGGALDHDGEGTILTTRQCLLNPNRNLGWTQELAEDALASSLGASKVLWLGDGLVNDHTDGHVDNLARFVAPGVVACPIAFGDDDPNAATYDETARLLGEMTDAGGRSLQVVRIPSPGLVLDEEGEIVPASHMNFLIANRAVVVPTYGEPAGRAAIEALTQIFPDRDVIGLPSTAILTGGGSFHCISQQEPADV